MKSITTNCSNCKFPIPSPIQTYITICPNCKKIYSCDKDNNIAYIKFTKKFAKIGIYIVTNYPYIGDGYFSHFTIDLKTNIILYENDEICIKKYESFDDCFEYLKTIKSFDFIKSIDKKYIVYPKKNYKSFEDCFKSLTTM